MSETTCNIPLIAFTLFSPIPLFMSLLKQQMFHSCNLLLWYLSNRQYSDSLSLTHTHALLHKHTYRRFALM